MRTVSACLVSAVVLAAAAGCGQAPPPPAATPASPVPPPSDARLQLAARAAAAGDRTFTGRWTWAGKGGEPRTVTVVRAVDGTWRVDIPGGALGGTADVAIAGVGKSVFSCSLRSAAAPTVAPTCVKVADDGRAVPAKYDPKVQHPFTDWIDVFTDRQAPLAVSPSQPLPGAPGACYAVDSISAAISSPLDAGIYCWSDDGLLTAARLPFGSLQLAGTPTAAPASIDLPGPVTAGPPLGMAAPPPAPSPSVVRSPAGIRPSATSAPGSPR
jgi:hypothetical protein